MNIIGETSYLDLGFKSSPQYFQASATVVTSYTINNYVILHIFLYIIHVTGWIYRMSHKSGAIEELGYLAKYGKI
jgi:hypothetical protein